MFHVEHLFSLIQVKNPFSEIVLNYQQIRVSLNGSMFHVEHARAVNLITYACIFAAGSNLVLLCPANGCPFFPHNNPQ